MALWAGVLLLLGAVVGFSGVVLDAGHRRAFFDKRAADERQRVEDSRAYLADLAKRIEQLPVDKNLASEIESRYFEELPRGRQYVWAVDATGGFSFGVPRAAFDRVNAVFDREVAPRLKDGVFVDRQTFLLTFIDDNDIVRTRRNPGGDNDLVERVEWRRDGGENGSVVLSAPLKTTAGVPVGSLYLKRIPNFETYYDDDRFKMAAAAGGIAALIAFFFLWILLPTWVYVDAQERGVRRAPLFAFLTAVSAVVGLLVYLIARPEGGRRLTCPGCSREVADGAFCPHCGRDLSRSFCAACRYPLQMEWSYCPACRTEVRTAPPPSAPAI